MTRAMPTHTQVAAAFERTAGRSTSDEARRMRAKAAMLRAAANGERNPEKLRAIFRLGRHADSEWIR
jgi:hypothetical protein